jgi:hypothetical protein
MADLGNFDANSVEPNKDFTALPAGRYEAMIVDSEMKATAAKTGEYLELTLVVLSGEYKDRQLWDRLNLKNPSDKAMQIAKGTLSSICRAVGVLTPRDSTQLHNLPLVVRVDVREHDGKTYNDVKAYYPKDAAPKPSASAVPVVSQVQPGAAPWKKG